MDVVKLSMPKPIKMQELIERAQLKHNLDYSKVDLSLFKNDIITIICPNCGEFETTMEKHLACKTKCSNCFKKSIMTFEKFKELANKKHYNLFEYSDFSTKKVNVKCKEHGIFDINPYSHLRGVGCRKCSNEKNYKNFKSIEKDNLGNGILICKNNHKTLKSWKHINENTECRECLKIKKEKIRNEKILNKFSKKYPNFEFISLEKNIIKFKCKDHGIIYKNINGRWLNGPCLECNPVNKKYSTEYFINESTKIFKDKYLYSKTKCNNCIDPVIISCKIHGNFKQIPYLHLMGHGCPVCATLKNLSLRKSKPELEIQKIIPESILNTREIIYPYELDVYSKKYNFAVEYNGLLWHSEGNTFPVKKNMKNYHLRKTELCEEKGIQLFHIFDNEWLDTVKKQIWISILKNKMGLGKTINIFETTLKKISKKESKEFSEKYSLTNIKSFKKSKGIFYQEELIAIFLNSKIIQKNGFQFNFKKLNEFMLKYNIDKIYFDRRYYSMKCEEFQEPQEYIFNESRKYYDCGNIIKRK